jgi:hypothetical protein
VVIRTGGNSSGGSASSSGNDKPYGVLWWRNGFEALSPNIGPALAPR